MLFAYCGMSNMIFIFRELNLLDRASEQSVPLVRKPEQI